MGSTLHAMLLAVCMGVYVCVRLSVSHGVLAGAITRRSMHAHCSHQTGFWQQLSMIFRLFARLSVDCVCTLCNFVARLCQGQACSCALYGCGVSRI